MLPLVLPNPCCHVVTTNTSWQRVWERPFPHAEMNKTQSLPSELTTWGKGKRRHVHKSFNLKQNAPSTQGQKECFVWDRAGRDGIQLGLGRLREVNGIYLAFEG